MDTTRGSMPPKEFERLFLMEFMINRIHYSNSSMKLDKDFLSSLGKTTVLINFKDIPLLEISEDDFIPKEEPFEDMDITFKNGKSCLFALRDNQITFQTCSTALITVQRKLPEGEEKEYFVIGEAQVDLSGSFMNVLSGCGVPCKCVCNTYNIKNGRDETVGTISLMVRLSNYGKMIMTQFQLAGGEGSSFLFKGVSDSALPAEFREPSRPLPSAPTYGMGNQLGDYSFGGMPRGMPAYGAPGPQGPFGPMMGPAPYGGGGMPGMPGMPGMMPGMPGMPGMVPGMPGMAGMPGAGPGYGFPQVPGAPYDPSYIQTMPPFPGGPGAPGIIAPGSMPIGAAGQSPVEEDPCDPRYKELTAEVNGYSLKIRLLRRPKK